MTWFPPSTIAPIYTKASNRVLNSKPEALMKRLDYVAARLFIRSESNIRSLATVNPSRIAIRDTAIKPYTDRIYEIDEKGNFVIPWSATLFPTEAYAQGMGHRTTSTESTFGK